ncbi:hypothetical protein ASD19_12715 [Microbacterium sp. Root53]|uniref:hypothetical protein n=1 Tax=Microbacterium sp. Root53 TaxID=1736553 RepID=UPI00070183CF|nr:hypothetical protein [Microbacterium sp. Root53]KQZ06588.1 hypothetical protein ASD19_12715 [Microbacterium sp. Root53]
MPPGAPGAPAAAPADAAAPYGGQPGHPGSPPHPQSYAPGYAPPGAPYGYAPPPEPRGLFGLSFGWGVLAGFGAGVVLEVVAVLVWLSGGEQWRFFVGSGLLAVIALGGIGLLVWRPGRAIGTGMLCSIAIAPIVLFGVCVAVMGNY